MTKRAAAARSAAWRTAVAEGRVVRFETGSFQSYATPAAAQAAAADAVKAGLGAAVVDVTCSVCNAKDHTRLTCPHAFGGQNYNPISNPDGV